MSVETITLASKRKVALHTLTKGERTVVMCHAAPGAGNFDPNPDATKKRRVSLIATDRPGYGASPKIKKGEWTTVSGAADDIAEILGKKGLTRVGVAGWSAGGRVALALAARHPELVDRVAVLCTPAPDEEVSWIPPEQKQGIAQMRGMEPQPAYKALGKQLKGTMPKAFSGKKLLSFLGAGPQDQAALGYKSATARISRMLKSAFERGAEGLAEDIVSYTMVPWGFENAGVKAKTLLLYGAKDPIVNSKHGTWWQKNLPNARLEMVPNAGHLLVIPMWERVLSFLAPGR